MREITLDINRITNINAVHEYLSDVFKFPDYYGKNLDALFDCLTDISENTTVIIPTAELHNNALDAYSRRLIHVFEKAAECNRFLTVQFDDIAD